MDKLKETFNQINAKVPVFKLLIVAALIANAAIGYGLIDLAMFEPNFLTLYGLEAASTVRERVDEQMRRYKPKDPPPPPPSPQMTYDERSLRQHNPFLPPGVIEESGKDAEEEKITDVVGIDLIGTVYSYTPQRRSALIEVNGIAMVVLEGKVIRGTKKRVVEIGRSRVLIQEENLLPAPVYLPSEHGLDDLTRALANNQFKAQSGWEYTTRGGKTLREKDLGAAEGEGDKEAKPAEGEANAEEKPKAAEKKKSKADEEATAAEEEEEEEETPAESSSGGSEGAGGATEGVDIGGGQ